VNSPIARPRIVTFAAPMSTAVDPKLAPDSSILSTALVPVGAVLTAAPGCV
jgi:hypothetical protein